MKKYVHYRVGLFIGLLIFNTLSACVDTRQELVVSSEKKEQDGLFGNLKKSDDFRSKAMAISSALAAGVLLTTGITATMMGAFCSLIMLYIKQLHLIRICIIAIV